MKVWQSFAMLLCLFRLKLGCVTFVKSVKNFCFHVYVNVGLYKKIYTCNITDYIIMGIKASITSNNDSTLHALVVGSFFMHFIRTYAPTPIGVNAVNARSRWRSPAIIDLSMSMIPLMIGTIATNRIIFAMR